MEEKNEKDVLKGHSHQEHSRHTSNNEHHGLKTDFPLSEKDEVKLAEERLRKGLRSRI